MTASRILDNGNQREKGYHGLEEVLQRDLGVTLDKDEQTSEWGVPDLAPTQIQYAAGDVGYLLPLRDILSKALAKKPVTTPNRATPRIITTMPMNRP